MKFENIYSETEENMRLALLSLWAPGNHPMRLAIKDLLDRESLLAEPVFQSTFGWEPSSDESWRGAINTEVWEKLEALRRQQAEMANKEFRPFHPFKHQAESWNTLKGNKSIVVTSGTGSGKTECFMYPVLSDLYEQKNNKAIKAIFLYPLNALMEDQKKRLSEYCKTLELRYAVYNGDTQDRDNDTKVGTELTTRKQIREHLPDILLTNPSMLEYILVRKADQQMLQDSAGKLRWIIIDEAHSYSGSAAVELAYQIKRILDAFGTEARNIRFACTSATIGGEEGAQSLADFISTLTGQPIEQIKVIGGNRLVPDLDETALEQTLAAQQIPVDTQRVIALRNQINKVAGMTLQQLWEWLCPNQVFNKDQIIPALRLVDALCEMQQEGKAVLSLRAHFFMRSINGLYACANENCEGKNHAIPLYGHLTTHKSSVCPKCGAPLLELVQCKPCSSFVLMGSSNDDTHKVYPCEEGFNTDDYFALNASDEDEEDEEETTGHRETFFLLPYDSTNFVKPTSIQETEVVYRKFEHDIKGTTLLDCDEENGKWVQIVHTENGNSYCPNCGKLAEGKKLYFKRFRIPISFINQAIAPVLLRECATNGYWGKYIAFTDSRQGTAISSKTFNINAERLQSYKSLLSHLKVNSERIAEIKKNLNLTDAQIEEFFPELMNSELNTARTREVIFSSKLSEHFSENEEDRFEYPKALLRNTIGRRPLYESNAETMGLIYLDYPTLKKINAPNNIFNEYETDLTLNDQAWQDYLKIAIDYFLRLKNHLQPVDDIEKNFIRESNKSKCIQPNNGKLKDVDKWISTRDQHGKISSQRLVVLLCAGLGIDTQEKFEQNENIIDELLKQAWRDLEQCGILISPNYDGKYYVDLSANSTICNIKRLEKAWVCPVTRRLLDTTFCGYSPMLKGRICKEWFEKYKCKEEDMLTMPCRPTDNNEVTQWMETDRSVQTMKNRGFWTDRHKYAYQYTPPFIAAEHSAQQSKERLQDYTKKFTQNPPQVNVFHCSTTMEMGVDIGDIEIVLMDTIPPTAANYLQRVGRAGRMGQSKALAFSLCNNTPVGQYAFEHPMWALQTVNHMAKVLSSQTIIQRHVNSYFFRQFICGEQGEEGMSVKVSVEDFMTNRCNTFIDFLDSISTDTKAQAQFAKVFGMGVPYAVDNTKKAIKALQEEYTQSISQLRNAITQFDDNDRRCLAISHQIRKTENENLLKYLSEHQFIPNANMPTGIVTFDFRDKGDCGKLNRLQGKLDRQYKLLEQNPERRYIQQEIDKLKKDIKNLHKATTAARDIRTALNEYAPGQTVVVNEKNYKSAGLAMYGAYNTETQTRALYHCGKCGHTEYIVNLDENRTCSVCGNNYHSIIDRNHSRFSLAYEPVGFCIDHNEDGTREEKTEKNYYDIRPLLLETDWRTPVQVNMCDVISSGETGRILFCNLGKGHGFAFCKHCGRVDLEYAQTTTNDNIPQGVRKGHQHLWYSDDRYLRTCDATNGDIARHVVFTGFHPTCYSALRFKKNAGCDEYEKDERLVYSLGVVLKRALVKLLGIDEGEVDFGVKEEREAYILFIYDTAKGGCGYSLRLCNAAFCQEVFDEARKSLEQANCNCHKEDGACTHCLVERNNYRFVHLLSKEIVLHWLNKQSDNVPQLSQEVLAYSPHAQIVYQNLKEIVKQAVKDSNTKTLSLFVSDVTDDYVLSDWSDIRQEMGRLISTAVQKGKTVNLYVEYHPQFHTEALDKYPFISLSDKFSSCNVSLIKDMGVYKTAIMVEDFSGGIRRYFTDTESALSFSKNWGEECDYAYTDTTCIDPEREQEPTYELPANCVIREGVTGVTTFPVKNYFSDAIAPYVLTEDQDKAIIKNILNEKRVNITYSDMYVNSALASLMLVYLIDNLKREFGFEIGNVTLQLDSSKRKCNNDKLNDYNYISFNFENKEDADAYTEKLFEDVLDITPEFSNEDAVHHRWLKLSTSDGGMVEIRPDHGISGGYISSSRYMNLDTLSGSVCAIRKDETILYYVIYKNGNA